MYNNNTERFTCTRSAAIRKDSKTHPRVPLVWLINNFDGHQGTLDMQLEECSITNILNDDLINLLSIDLSTDGLLQCLLDCLDMSNLFRQSIW